jgi:hypothetical protein
MKVAIYCHARSRSFVLQQARSNENGICSNFLSFIDDHRLKQLCVTLLRIIFFIPAIKYTIQRLLDECGAPSYLTKPCYNCKGYAVLNETGKQPWLMSRYEFVTETLVAYFRVLSLNLSRKSAENNKNLCDGS